MINGSKRRKFEQAGQAGPEDDNDETNEVFDGEEYSREDSNSNSMNVTSATSDLERSSQMFGIVSRTDVASGINIDDVSQTLQNIPTNLPPPPDYNNNSSSSSLFDHASGSIRQSQPYQNQNPDINSSHINGHTRNRLDWESSDSRHHQDSLHDLQRMQASSSASAAGMKPSSELKGDPMKGIVRLSKDTKNIIAKATTAGIPVADTLEQFQENPENFQPQPLFIVGYIENDTYMTRLIKKGHIQTVKKLLQYGADPNQKNLSKITPIAAAANKGLLQIVQDLIDFGANVNSVNGTGTTALIQAAHFGFLDVVKLLILNGANVNFVNQKGTTALMRSSQEGFIDITMELLNAGADVRRCNNEKLNSLMLASQRGNLEMTSTLLRAGANVEAVTRLGSSALMLTAKRGRKECIEELLRCGAEIYKCDSNGHRASSHAKRKQYLDLLPLFDSQVQISLMSDSIKKMRNSLLVTMVYAFGRRKLILTPPYEFIHCLVNYLRKWSTNIKLSKDNNEVTKDPDAILDMNALNAAMSPMIHTLYPHLTLEQCQIIQFKASMSVLRSLEKEDPLHLSDAARSVHAFYANQVLNESLLHYPRENYENLRRHLGSRGLAPSETRNILSKCGLMDDRFHVSHIPTQPSLSFSLSSSPSGGVSIMKPTPGPSGHPHLWSMMWVRAMQKLPSDCLKYIISFIPSPRIWDWSLLKIKEGLEFRGAEVIMRDLFIIVDEVFTDSNLFTKYTKHNQSSQERLLASNHSAPSTVGGVPLKIVGLPVVVHNNMDKDKDEDEDRYQSSDIDIVDTLVSDTSEMNISYSENIPTYTCAAIEAVSAKNNGNGNGNGNGNVDTDTIEYDSNGNKIESNGNGNGNGNSDNNQGQSSQPPTEEMVRKAKVREFFINHKQEDMLIHIANNPSLQRYLVQFCEMPLSMVQNCIYWSSHQAHTRSHTVAYTENPSSSNTTPNNYVPDAKTVKTFYIFVKSLVKWFQHRHCPLSSLEMPLISENRSPLPPSDIKKYSPFIPLASPTYYAQSSNQDTTDNGGNGNGNGNEHMHSGLQEYPPRILLYESTSVFVNYIMESAIYSTTHKGNGDGNHCVDSTGGLYDRGIPGLNYANVYDSDDSDDSLNNANNNMDMNAEGNDET
jgi:ankyrin repeat protein